MSFYLINQDYESPIKAIKSSHVANLEFVFKEGECSKWDTIIPEWYDGTGSFTAVSQSVDELKIRTKAPHDNCSFEALISPPISEREIDILLTTLVDRQCLNQKYKQHLFRELAQNFAMMRLLPLKKQGAELLEQLTRAHRLGVVYLHRVNVTERLSITSESKKNISASINQLTEILEVINKMMVEKKMITKEDVALLRSLKPSCYIKSESSLEKGWFADKSFADDVNLFVRDFDTFLRDILAKNLSATAARFIFHKQNLEQKSSGFENKLSQISCPIL